MSGDLERQAEEWLNSIIARKDVLGTEALTESSIGVGCAVPATACDAS
jgi:hypothetical protein